MMIRIVKSISIAILLLAAASLTSPVFSAEDVELKLRLTQCIEAALANNRDIMIERMNVMEANGEIERAWSIFDPVATAQTSFSHAEQPSASSLYGSSANEQESVIWNMGVQAMVPTGAVLNLDFQNQRTETNSALQQLNPQFQTSLVFSIAQPLLQGFGFVPSLYRVKLAKNNFVVSEIELQNVVLSTVSKVENAYWNLVLAIENLKVAKLSKQLAGDILKMTQAQVKLGVLAPVATLQAETAVAGREESVILAENSVNLAQRELLRVMNAYNDGKPVKIIPLDLPAGIQEAPDYDKVRSESIANNFQLRQLDYQSKTVTLTRRVARNAMLPQLNILGSVGVVGIAGDAGDPATQVVQTGRVIPDPTGTSIGILETTTLTSPPSPYDGTYLDAVEDMINRDFTSWSVGMQFRYPLGNRAARRDYSRAIIEEKKTAFQIENLRELIITLIENMIGNMQTAVKRVEASTKSVEVANKNMEAEVKKFKVGISTNRDVLETQQTYSLMLMSKIQALIDYNKIRGSLERAKMGYLEISVSTSISSSASSASTTTSSAASSATSSSLSSQSIFGTSSIP